MPDVVIAVPVYGQLEMVERCLASIDATTPEGVAILVVDDCGPRRVDASTIENSLSSTRECRLVRHQANRGFVGSVNHIFELAGRSDVIVVNSDVTVLPGWFAALEAAVMSDERFASASTMADRGGILSVGELSEDSALSRLQIARQAVGVGAEIPVAVAHCSWFRRSALDQIGGFDTRFAPGYGEEVDWSLRAERAGLRHVAALGSFVRHAGSASFGSGGGLFSLQRRHEALLLMRYRRRWFDIRRYARDPNTDLALAKARIARCLRGESASSAE
jgi:GT2 family glycosyltransferase